MKVKLVEKLLKEGVSKEELKNILMLIGQAHDKIMEAQDELSSLGYDYDDEIIDSLSYDLDDIEASLSELDFMGEDDVVQCAYEHYELNESLDDEKYVVYCYGDEDGDKLITTFEFDDEQEAFAKADEVYNDYARVEIISPDGEKVY